MSRGTGAKPMDDERLERLLGDTLDDVNRLRAEVATLRAAIDELTELLARVVSAPYFTGRAIADLTSQQRG